LVAPTPEYVKLTKLPSIIVELLLANTALMVCDTPLFDGVKAETEESIADTFGIDQVKTVVALFPEYELTIPKYCDVCAVALRFGPEVKPLKGTPNVVVPDKIVFVLSLCLICLLSE
jgi:hypothetical protein